MTREDALALVWAELRRLAHLIAELADRLERIERRDTEETHGKED